MALVFINGSPLKFPPFLVKQRCCRNAKKKKQIPRYWKQPTDIYVYIYIFFKAQSSSNEVLSELIFYSRVGKVAIMIFLSESITFYLHSDLFLFFLFFYQLIMLSCCSKIRLVQLNKKRSIYHIWDGVKHSRYPLSKQKGNGRWIIKTWSGLNHSGYRMI